MFFYRAIFRTNREEPPAGLIVVEASTGPLRAVMWSHRGKAWTFSPEIAAPMLFDDRNFDRWTEVDRSRAEEIALTLGTELPSELELHRISNEGEQAQIQR